MALQRSVRNCQPLWLGANFWSLLCFLSQSVSQRTFSFKCYTRTHWVALHHGCAVACVVESCLYTLCHLCHLWEYQPCQCPSKASPCPCPSCMGRIQNYKIYLRHHKLMEQLGHDSEELEQPVTQSQTHCKTGNNNDNFQHPSKWPRPDSSASVGVHQTMCVYNLTYHRLECLRKSLMCQTLNHL
jgi:hypothetical protein